MASVIGPSGRLFRSQKTATHRLRQSLSIKKKKKERKEKLRGKIQTCVAKNPLSFYDSD